MNWVSQLEVNPKTGHAATTVENIRIIVALRAHSTSTSLWSAVIFLGEKQVLSLAPGTIPTTPASITFWRKTIRMPKTREGVDLALADVTRHPVREYLQSLVWDGEKRCETVFIDYLGAEDSRYGNP